MADSVSPALMVYVAAPPAAGFAEAGVSEVVSDKLWPAMMTFGSLMAFRLASLSIAIPVVDAIADKVSPGWIRYVVAPSRADANDCADTIATMTPTAAPTSCNRQLRRGMNARARSPSVDVCRTRRRGRVRLVTLSTLGPTPSQPRCGGLLAHHDRLSTRSLNLNRVFVRSYK